MDLSVPLFIEYSDHGPSDMPHLRYKRRLEAILLTELTR